MNEIYWLTRLDGIHGIFLALAVISVIAAIMTWILYYATLNPHDQSSYPGGFKLGKSRWKATIAAVVFIASTVMIPTKQDAFLIWGVGTTVDYVKENATLQEIPDKCVEALDNWVESIVSDKSNTKNE